MKILIIDDNRTHLNAATTQLGAEHSLTVAQSYDEGKRLLLAEPFGFEAVLCDLLMPASGEQQGRDGMRYVGQEMPVGIFLALFAAQRGAKYVAILTDSDHHGHPSSACLDMFLNRDNCLPAPFQVCETKFLMSNTSNHLIFIRDSDDQFLRTEKNWSKLLDHLLTC